MARNYTPTTWAVEVLNRLHIKPTRSNVQAIVGWYKAEGGHWNNSARYNPLNTTQVMPGAGTMNSAGVKVYKSWEQGLQATIKTLRYPAYKNILRQLRSGSPMGVANAIEASPWGTGGLAKSTIPRTKIGKLPNVPSSGSSVDTPERVTTTMTSPGVDNSQVRQQLVLDYARQRNRPGSLLSLAGGLRSAADVAPTFETSVSRSQPSSRPSRRSGAQDYADPNVTYAPGSARAGVGPTRLLKDFVSSTARRTRTGKVTVGTTTNHSRLTVNNNVSDHWAGNGADIPMPVDSVAGDNMAAHALQAAGVPWKRAIQMARKGGAWTITPSSGPYKGHRIQIIWRTNIGGNHHNHVHIGLK